MQLLACLCFGKELSHTIIMLFSKEHKEKAEVLTAVTKSGAIMCHQISDTVQSVAVSKAQQPLFICQL